MEKGKKKTLKILGTIDLVIVIIAFTILTFVVMSQLTLKLSGIKDYIFFVVPKYNVILQMAIVILIWSLFFAIRTFKNKDEVAESSFFLLVANLLEKHIGKLKTVIILIVLICTMSAAATSGYDMIGENELIKKRLTYKRTYAYEDIERIKMGITSGFCPFEDVNLYYDIYFRDGKKIEVLGGSFEQGGDDVYELEIAELDNKILEKGIERVIDTKNVKKFLKQNYDDIYEKNVLDLLGVTEGNS